MTLRSAAGVAMAGALLLAGCATTSAGGQGPGALNPAPSQTTSPAPEPGDENPDDEVPADTAWLVTATTSQFTASARLCPGDGMMAVPMDPDFTGIFAETNGGPPDDWDGSSMYQVAEGVLLDLGAKKYSYTYDAGGDRWDAAGKLTIEYDEAGRPRSGSGTGPMMIIYSSGDITRTTEATSFTIEPADAAPWCFL